jgi:hypothetical protein
MPRDLYTAVSQEIISTIGDGVNYKQSIFIALCVHYCTVYTYRNQQCPKAVKKSVKFETE